MKKKIIIFVGPTLPVAEVEKILPDAFCVAPVKCGDILHLLRQEPDVFAIIDGYFEQTASVWHKEILYAMQRGIQVFGASSMGALRACELSRYGMSGMGKIFEQYCDGRLEADDEVAVAHLDKESDYRVLSDAMVNIRATLDEALLQSVISKQAYQQIVLDLKAEHYSERHFVQYLNRQHQYVSLTYWIKENGMIDQKQIDARVLLKYLKENIAGVETKKCYDTPQSMFFKALQHKIYSDYLKEEYTWLRKEEVSIINKAKHNNQHYEEIKRLAALLAVSYQLAGDKNKGNRSVQYLLPEISNYTDILTDINSVIGNSDLTEEDILQTLHYFSLVDNVNPDIKNLYSYYSSILWVVIFKRVQCLDLMAQEVELTQLSIKFRQGRGLLSAEKFNCWLQEKKLSLMDYHHFLESAYWFDFIVACFNVDVLIQNYQENNHWWFSIALSLISENR